MKPWTYGALVLAMFCADGVSARPKRRVPEPGYACVLKQSGAFGVISSEFGIPADGKPYGMFVRWDAGDGTFRDPWVTASFFRQPDGRFSLDYGYVAIMSHIWAWKKRRPQVQRLTLELTTSVAPSMRNSRLASELQRSGGPFHLQAGWSDAAALAKGAAHLYVVGRNKRAEIVSYSEIDRMMFERAEPEILAAFDTVRKMTADPARHCPHVEDLGSDDIVV